jgi:2-polyprenyl-6-methoxyphenol hydroxylase-like FAD-dependent oxidoreductase
MVAAATTAPVAIIGAGPVGLALALLLDHHGVSCTVFNDRLATRTHPLGNTHNARTMEHYRRLGIATDVRKLGLPADHPTDVAYFTRYNAFELARLRMPSRIASLQAVAESSRTDQIPEPLHRANQMYVEALLLERARRRRGVTVKAGWRVEELGQDRDGVTLRARSVQDGTSASIRAAYAVGADGGRSIVRRSIGSRLQGDGALDGPILGGRAAAIHLRLPTFHHDLMPHRKAWSYWALNHEVAMNLIALDGGDEFSLLTGSVDPGDLDEAALTDLVRRAAGAAIPVQILGHRSWTPGVALVAESFAEGRVFLVGDAAHLFTPTGGFGMNTGIDDAANLAWKLAAAVRGWGRSELLASYEQERRPIAVRNTSAARTLNQNLGAIERPTELERDSGVGSRLRGRLGGLLATYGEQFASIGVQLGGRYDGSPIVATDSSAPPASLTTYTPSSVPGGRAPHLWLNGRRDTGASLYDRLGRGFTVLRMGARPQSIAPLRAAAAAAGMPLKVLDVPDPVARELYERDLVLIRPDQHVAWRGNRLPTDAGMLVAQVSGAGQ